MSVRATPTIRASHLNTGTSVPADELPWPKNTDSPVARLPKLHVEVDQRTEVTTFGGLSLAVQLVHLLKIPEILDRHVHVLKRHLPYHESDHILAQALSLYCGGSCIEDMAHLQQSEAILRMVGACRLPDPTTGGDFLRRFEYDANPRALWDLQKANDEIQTKAWKRIRKKQRQQRRRGRKNAKTWTMVDVDGHLEETTGAQKEADFSRKGTWSYQPLAITLGETGEVLALRNRLGSTPASSGSNLVLQGCLQRVTSVFGKNVLTRADSEFDRADIRQACEAEETCFALVGRAFANRPGMAESIPEEKWRPFRTRASRLKDERRNAPGYRPRAKKANLRMARAAEKGWKELALLKQWVAEVPYVPPEDPSKTYRLVIRRQLIEHRQGQLTLFTEYRYRYVVTNLPKSWSPFEVIDATYERCDQEKVIQQLGAGVSAWRMPVAEYDGNSAWLEIARLAWNLAKWVAQLALPTEVVRWEWKRFRLAFVIVSAQVINRGRQVWLRLSASHRFHSDLVAAHTMLQR